MRQNNQTLRPEAAQVIRDAVTASDWRQTDLAVVAGISSVYLNHMLQGRKPMRPDVAAKLARPLNLEAALLFATSNSTSTSSTVAK